MLFSYKEVSRVIPSTISGIVVEQESGLPVEKAHVYIIKGEEESITDSKGVFRILSWKKFPVAIITEHAKYEVLSTKVTSAGEGLIIKVKRK